MLGHKQKLLGHVPRCAGAWLRHCNYVQKQQHIGLEDSLHIVRRVGGNHPGGNHWVALPNIGCSLGRVQWLDSLHGSPSLSQQKIVAHLLQATVDKTEIQTMNVQRNYPLLQPFLTTKIQTHYASSKNRRCMYISLNAWKRNITKHQHRHTTSPDTTLSRGDMV